MKARKKLKLRALPSSKVKNVDLQKKVEKIIRKANERIKSVSKKYKGTTYMWAVNRLKTKVGDKYFRGNRLVLPKKIKQTELIKIYKEAESFLRSKESTKTGIKEIQESAKRTIKTDLFEGKVTDEDIDTYYSMLEDKDFTGITNKDFDPSEFWHIIDYAIKEDLDEDSFVEMIQIHVMSFDENVRQKAINLYKKYVNRKN